MDDGERRKQKNLVLFGVLLSLAILLFTITIIKIAQLSSVH